MVALISIMSGSLNDKADIAVRCLGGTHCSYSAFNLTDLLVSFQYIFHTFCGFVCFSKEVENF